MDNTALVAAKSAKPEEVGAPESVSPIAVMTASTEKPENSNHVSRALKLLAYPVAAVSGMWAVNTHVHNSAYNTAKALGAFDDILKIATPKSKRIFKNVLPEQLRVKNICGDLLKVKKVIRRWAKNAWNCLRSIIDLLLN